MPWLASEAKPKACCIAAAHGVNEVSEEVQAIVAHTRDVTNDTAAPLLAKSRSPDSRAL